MLHVGLKDGEAGVVLPQEMQGALGHADRIFGQKGAAPQVVQHDLDDPEVGDQEDTLIVPVTGEITDDP